MAKHQTRRSVSLSGPTYAAISARAAAAEVSLSSLVERAIAAELRRCSYVEGAFWCGAQAGETGRCGRHIGVVAKAVASVVRAIPSESRIVAGPPPEQTTMLGRTPTPPADPVRGVDPAPSLRGAALRPLMNAAARAHAVRRERPAAPPPPIRSGFEPAPASAKPVASAKVPPPDPSRVARNVVTW